MTGLETLVAIGTAVGGVVSAVGTIQSANAQAAAAQYNADIADRNAKIARQQGAAEQDDQRRENRRQLAAIRAAYGATGLDMAGSPLDVLEDTSMEQELDVERIGYQAELRAIGNNEQADLARMEAKNAKKAGMIGAASALLSGASNAGQTLMRAN